MTSNSPAIDLIDYSGATRNAVDILKVLTHPFYKVVFIDPFDYLMQQIGGDYFIYISSWEVRRIRLWILRIILFL